MCIKIAKQYGNHENCNRVLEIGPGTGALTRALLDRGDLDLSVMDVDKESIAYLHEHFSELEGKIHDQDFLKLDLASFSGGEQMAVVGNFPYNISSQIIFKCITYRKFVPEIMGMFQKEMAERIAEPPGSKQYGIISVLTQAFYDVSYCFTVHENMFNPPPKVKSGVIRCIRKEVQDLECDEKLFIQVVKTAFNQRRKTLRNSLKQLIQSADLPETLLQNRPEQLKVADFVAIANAIAVS